MFAGRLPSLTAMMVACARGLPREAPDPFAEHLLPRPIGAALRSIHSLALRVDVVERTASALSLGLVTHLLLRTRAIDDVVIRAAEDGVSQLVILGAGLDARAHRMSELATVSVYEIDHPATQQYKTKRSTELPQKAHALAYVGVDFERDDLRDRLETAGHRAADRTIWIWEGVTPYLTREAIGGTLDAIAERSATGSVLAMTYGTPEMTSWGGTPKKVIPSILRILGEPFHGLMEPEEAATMVRARGFDVADDAGAAEWAERFAYRVPERRITERLLVARRAPT
jgi:methyltransferase (TIGR00027 family)